MPSFDDSSTTRPLWEAMQFTLSWIVVTGALTLATLATIANPGPDRGVGVDLADSTKLPTQP